MELGQIKSGYGWPAQPKTHYNTQTKPMRPNLQAEFPQALQNCYISGWDCLD